MISDTSIIEWYSKHFISGFKEICKKDGRFTADFNKLRDYCKNDDHLSKAVVVPRLPEGCQGFMVMKIRDFYCKESNIKGKTVRIIFTKKENNVIFLECYLKKKQSNMNDETVCGDLDCYKKGDREGLFVVLSKPDSRALLQRGSQ